MQTEDGELVRRTLAGDTLAFELLVDRYRDAICAVAYHHLGRFEDAQDMAQEAFIAAYMCLPKLRDPERFAPWLRRIIENRCASLQRRHGYHLVTLIDLTQDRLPAAETEHGRCIDRLAAHLAAREALDHLPDAIRLTVTLYYMGGYSHAEIAEFLGVTSHTVHRRLQCAKNQLREEMLEMVNDMIRNGKPDHDYTRHVVEEALRRGDEARQSNATGDAIRHYDAALEALKQTDRNVDLQLLKIDALEKKGAAVRFPQGAGEQIKLYKQAAALATKLGDRKRLAGLQLSIGSAGSDVERRRWYRKALRLHQEIGDAQGQIECLLFLGGSHLFDKKVQEGRDCFEQALAALETVDDPQNRVLCHAALDLINLVGAERLPHLRAWQAVCTVLENREGRIELLGQPGWISINYPEDAPADVQFTSVLWQVGFMRTILDLSQHVGEIRSGDACSFSYQPLPATLTVKSDTERITTPAGTFENCLMTELVVRESGQPDNAAEREVKLNRVTFCGTRKAWYAPGVGLVQLHICREDGIEARIQLAEYTILDAGTEYLPLALGNTWAYTWPDAPDEYRPREIDRVLGYHDGRWYIEHLHIL